MHVLVMLALWGLLGMRLAAAASLPDVVPAAATDMPPILELLANFAHEPTIEEVREAAVVYGEVSPKKIARWRRRAALQALLPTVDFAMSRDRSLDAALDQGTFPRFQIVETEARDLGVDVSVKWDLGRLIWNDDQTSIDVRSKLMVQLRDDLLDEATKAYFERRRLQIFLLLSPPAEPRQLAEHELRVQELTATLDNLTGGYFSSRLTLWAHQPTEASWNSQ